MKDDSASARRATQDLPANRAKGAGFGDLAPRVVSAIVLALLAGGTLVAGGAPFVVFWLLTAGAANWEWQTLIGAPHRLARTAIGAASLALLAALVENGAPLPAFAIFALACLATAAVAGQGRRLWAAGGLAYASALLASVTALRDEPTYGLAAVAWLFAVVWGTDVLAYFGGRLIGGAKLWPRVSAGKTWSGSIVGCLGGALLGVGVAHAFLGGAAASAPLFALGALASVMAQLGDLFESAVKRRFGVKDASSLIPGHGGVMDRIDGFLAAVAFAAAIGALHGPGSAAAGLFSW